MATGMRKVMAAVARRGRATLAFPVCTHAATLARSRQLDPPETKKYFASQEPSSRPPDTSRGSGPNPHADNNMHPGGLAGGGGGNQTAYKWPYLPDGHLCFDPSTFHGAPSPPRAHVHRRPFEPSRNPRARGLQRPACVPAAMSATASGAAGVRGGHPEEGVGESSSPPRSRTLGSGGRVRKFCQEVFERLVADGHVEAAAASASELPARLEAHFARLPMSYQLDMDVDKAEDVLIHHKVLAEAKDPDKRLNLAFHVRYHGFEELNVDTTTNSDALKGDDDDDEAIATRAVKSHTHTHEIVFSAIDKPKLLSQLSDLLADIGLNIREAHVFSTNDGYSLDAFIVDGWLIKDTEGLHKALEASIIRIKGSCSGSDSLSIDKLLPFQAEDFESDIDRTLLNIREKVDSGSHGDLFRGTYCGENVAVKVLSSTVLNEIVLSEFKHEILMLREVDHANIVQLIGSCTKPPQFCIITEYMSGGSLYDFLHKEEKILQFPTLLKFALDICRGMAYLHQKGIIHRDLKSPNLLIDKNNVVKVADLGVARFEHPDGVMTAETGTYRWMAPEVMNHQPKYDYKADVYSFAIVLWELMTSKIPYIAMTPVQAAVGVQQGLRPELPENAHPRLLTLLQRCWDAVPSNRPSFSDVVTELEYIQAHPQLCYRKRHQGRPARKKG